MVGEKRRGKGVVIFLIILLILAGFLAVKEISIVNNECLKEKAEDYCEGEGLIYHYHNNYLKPAFFCKENKRIIDSTSFSFTKEEKQECLG